MRVPYSRPIGNVHSFLFSLKIGFHFCVFQYLHSVISELSNRNSVLLAIKLFRE